MKKLPRIIKIIGVRPFVVTTLWNNGEEREIDFAPFIEQWKKEGNLTFTRIANFEIFKEVSLSDGNTLCWQNVPITIQLSKKQITAPLDIDPDFLFANSIVVHKMELPLIGNMLKTARETAGLTQTEVAVNSGTTRNYISRIENNRSDIQLDTLFKIVKLGIGKDLKMSIG